MIASSIPSYTRSKSEDGAEEGRASAVVVKAIPEVPPDQGTIHEAAIEVHAHGQKRPHCRSVSAAAPVPSWVAKVVGGAEQRRPTLGIRRVDARHDFADHAFPD